MNLNRLDRVVLKRIASAIEPITALMLARELKPGGPLKGHYNPISVVVAKLRKSQLLVDVAERCDHCHRALTRSQRDVALTLTDLGHQAVLTLS